MYTALDLTEYLMATTGGGAQDAEHRVLRQAVFHAYRDLVSVREWRWYHTKEDLYLSTSSRVSNHVLPWGVSSVDSVMLTEPEMLADYVEPMTFERMASSDYADGMRLVWTISPSKTFIDRMELRILNGARWTSRLILTYRRRPRDLRVTGYEPTSRAGSIDWSGDAVTGSGTKFSNQHVGCVIRVSGDSSWHPESLAGMHPYTDEGIVTSVSGQNALYAWSPAGQFTYFNTKYVLTDYLDVAPTMYTALLSGAEVWAARLLGKSIDGATGIYGRDLRLAFEADAMAPISGRRDGQCGYYNWWYLRPGADTGNGGGTGGGGIIGGGGGDTGACPNLPDLDGNDADGPWDAAVDGGNADTTYGACG